MSARLQLCFPSMILSGAVRGSKLPLICHPERSGANATRSRKPPLSEAEGDPATAWQLTDPKDLFNHEPVCLRFPRIDRLKLIRRDQLRTRFHQFQNCMRTPKAHRLKTTDHRRTSAIISMYSRPCVATAPIRICPRAGSTFSSARADIWQYSPRKRARISSAAINPPNPAAFLV